jgi:cytoplasmic iron level regulating protein YaaA (DUF328/UPF0246 family)
MMIILSPAKRLSIKPRGNAPIATEPRFRFETEAIVKELKNRNINELIDLLKVSSKLGQENHLRFTSWQWSEAKTDSTLPALMAYDGDAFNALKAWEFNQGELLRAQKSLRIISALYGMLRPLDLIMPYRLEMQASLSVNGKKDLYAFWGERLAQSLLDDMSHYNDSVIINLASQEYSKSVLPYLTSEKIAVVTPVFYQLVNQKFQFSALYSKQARGKMTRFIIQNAIDNPEHLVAFHDDNYLFHEGLSNQKQLVFYRHLR